MFTSIEFIRWIGVILTGMGILIFASGTAILLSLPPIKWSSPNIPTAYISGPMSGYRLKNVQSFLSAERELKKKKYNVVNPATKPHEQLNKIATRTEWQVYLREDLVNMLNGCTEIWMLPGWENSEGANFELQVAKKVGMKVQYFKKEDLNAEGSNKT